MRKKAFAFVLFFFVVLLTFGDDLKGFLGIPWGISREVAISTLLSQRGIKPFTDGEHDNENFVLYESPQFAGRNVESISLRFYKNQFYMATVTQKAEQNMAIRQYYSFKSDLMQKYSVPDVDVEEYILPYQRGDGNEETALFVNKLKIYSGWNFKNSMILLEMHYAQGLGISISLNYIFSPIYNIIFGVEQSSNLGDL